MRDDVLMWIVGKGGKHIFLSFEVYSIGLAARKDLHRIL